MKKMKPEREAMNQRFKLVYKELEKRGEIVKNSREKSKAQFAERLQMRSNMIDRCLNDEYPITYEAVDLLCNAYGVNRLYMREGVGTPFDAKRPTSDAAPINGLPIGKVQFAGLSAFAGTTDGEDREEVEVFMLPGVSGTMAGFNVYGDSMEPTLLKGDLILCTPVFDPSELKDDEVYVVTMKSDKAIYVKRIEKIFDKRGNWTHLRFHSDNKIYDPFDVMLSELRSMYKVTRRITTL